MEIITGYTGKAHIFSEQDRDVNIGIVGEGSYVLQTGMQLEAEVSSNNEIKIRDGVLMHQGCTASIKKNTYDSLTIINGSQGMKRIDLIVARYERNQDNGTESISLKVIQGTPEESNPAVPSHITGDIQSGDAVADMPMYKIIIDGLNITEVQKVYSEAPNITELNRNLQSGYTHLSEDEIGYVKFSNGLKAIYGTYPAQAMIDERPTTGGYSVTIDISKYGLKNPLFTLASPRYSQGHPTATVHSVSENAIKIGCNINYDGCFITWLVIG
nr:MAG TPA: hypothetical protein [Caudoviricetes sp.]